MVGTVAVTVTVPKIYLVRCTVVDVDGVEVVSVPGDIGGKLTGTLLVSVVDSV